MSEARMRFLEKECDRADLPEHVTDEYLREIVQLQTIAEVKKAKLQVIKDQRLKEEQEQALQDKYLSITDEQVDQMEIDFRKLHKDWNEQGRTFEEWFNQAVALYDVKLVGKHYQVTSVAKSADEVVWDDFVSVPHARSKILELIKIKFRDHHLRLDREGCDFAHIPENEELGPEYEEWLDETKAGSEYEYRET